MNRKKLKNLEKNASLNESTEDICKARVQKEEEEGKKIWKKEIKY